MVSQNTPHTYPFLISTSKNCVIMVNSQGILTSTLVHDQFNVKHREQQNQLVNG